VIFIDIKNRACEKTSLPLKRTIGGFISAWPVTAESITGDHSANWSREKQGTNSAVSFGGFVTAD
jgi:hypothetical protein